jgi:predicted amidohydrolase YtcJ
VIDPDADVAAEVARVQALRTEFDDGDLLRVSGAKIFVDGVIESHTAALLAPYLDTPDRDGALLIDPTVLARLVRALEAAGLSPHFHAIGDRAARVTLEAVAAAGVAPGLARPQLAHLELLDPADIGRFRELGAIANFEPLWAYDDDELSLQTFPVLGPARSREIYLIGSVARTHAALSFGSDWPVSSPAPLEGIEVSVTRRAPGGGGRPALESDEAIDLDSALRAYTAGGAYALGLEREVGSIEVGKRADLVVLSRNPFTLPPTALARAQVVQTFLGGRIVYATRGSKERTAAAAPKPVAGRAE